MGVWASFLVEELRTPVMLNVAKTNQTNKQKMKLVAEMQEVSEKAVRSGSGCIHSLSQDILIYCLVSIMLYVLAC